MQCVSHDRREFMSKSFCFAAAASLAAFDVRSASAQAQGTLPPIQRSGRYDDSFITQRKPFKWPGNNTLAVWFAPNVEVWQYNSAFGVGITPNPTNHLCSEAAKLDRFWLESSASIPWLGGAESDEGIEIFGRPEGVHSQARRRWRAGG
jgi:hypothetical protein